MQLEIKRGRASKKPYIKSYNADGGELVNSKERISLATPVYILSWFLHYIMMQEYH